MLPLHLNISIILKTTIIKFDKIYALKICLGVAFFLLFLELYDSQAIKTYLHRNYQFT